MVKIGKKLFCLLVSIACKKKIIKMDVLYRMYNNDY